jgi:hypothetical protein
MMLENALKNNQLFLNHIVDYVNHIEQEDGPNPIPQTKPVNRPKIKTTIKQFFREWCDLSK